MFCKRNLEIIAALFFLLSQISGKSQEISNEDLLSNIGDTHVRLAINPTLRVTTADGVTVMDPTSGPLSSDAEFNIQELAYQFYTVRNDCKGPFWFENMCLAVSNYPGLQVNVFTLLQRPKSERPNKGDLSADRIYNLDIEDKEYTSRCYKSKATKIALFCQHSADVGDLRYKISFALDADNPESAIFAMKWARNFAATQILGVR